MLDAIYIFSPATLIFVEKVFCNYVTDFTLY